MDKGFPESLGALENATPNPKAINANPINEAKIRKKIGGEPKELKGVVHIDMSVVSPIMPKMPNTMRKKMGKPGVMLFVFL